jgi:hypothetical protein
MKFLTRRVLPFLLLLFFCSFFPGILKSQEIKPTAFDTVIFRVDMSYMASNGQFNPLTDTVRLAGSMTNWGAGVPMERTDTGSLVYATSFVLVYGVNYDFLLRLETPDTTLTENVDPYSRKVHVWDSTMTVSLYYGNINPSKVAVKFTCNMYYQVKAGHFSTAADYPDITGNFNGWTKRDLLFADATDSLYSLVLLIDTTWINKDLRFKFQFNGNDSTTELQGDSARTYTVVAGTNVYSCWYNNIDPTIPALPIAYNVQILGSLEHKQVVTGAYTYEDYNLKPEGSSKYQWFLADSIGGALSILDTARTINLTIDTSFIGKYIVFEVIPLTRDSLSGVPVKAWSTSKIVGVGIGEHNAPIARIYPNPAGEVVRVDPNRQVLSTEILDPNGHLLFHSAGNHQSEYTVGLGHYPPGIYFLRLTGEGHVVSVFRIIHF